MIGASFNGTIVTFIVSEIVVKRLSEFVSPIDSLFSSSSQVAPSMVPTISSPGPELFTLMSGTSLKSQNRRRLL